MFEFWNKKVNNIEIESDKIDSMLVYLNGEIKDMYESMLNLIANDIERLALKNNEELVIKTYGKESAKLFSTCDEYVQRNFIIFFQNKAKSFQSKMHGLIGSTFVLSYMRSNATEDSIVLSEYINQIIVELQSVYDNQ